MSSRIFQSVIVQMKNATSRSIGVISPEGSVIASSNLSLIGTELKPIHPTSNSCEDMIAVGNGKTFKPLFALTGSDYCVFTEGEDELARTICILVAVAITEAGVFFEENNDKRSLIKSIIMENILPGDIHIRAKELRFSTDAIRGVIVIRHGVAVDTTVVELLNNLFADRQNEFVISVTDK